MTELRNALTPFVAAIALCVLWPAVGHADDNSNSQYRENSVGGAIVDVQQPYVGANAKIYPVPWIQYSSGNFYVEGLTAGYTLSQEGANSLAFVVQPQWNGVNANESPALAGINSRSQSMDGGLGDTFHLGPQSVSVTLQHDLLGKSNGSSAGLSWTYPTRLGDGVLILTGGLQWQDAKFDSYYYGVTMAESRPGRAAYSPGSALNLTGGVIYSHPIVDSWKWTAGALYTRLGSAIVQSPLVAKHYQGIALVGLSYSY